MATEGAYDKDEVVFKAKLAEQAERYSEMKDFMKKVVTNSTAEGLNQEERNLLSVAFKNVVGARRASWRVLDSIARKEEPDNARFKYVKEYKENVETELTDICNDILELLADKLLKNAHIKPEERVFYHKMKGDYHRYMAEYVKGDPRVEVVEDARAAYDQALEAARSLPATNPIRLGLSLNFSVFYYEILQDQKNACHLAKESFDKAVGELEGLTEEEYKDATLIMQLLRDNLTLWQSEGDAEEMPIENDGTAIEDC